MLNIYCREGAMANIEGVKKIFHEKAFMNGHGKDGNVFGPIRNLYDLYNKFGLAPESECHVDVLDVAGNTAIGRIAIKNWHGMDFIDFHELIRENGQWKIRAKTCRQL